MFSDQSADNRHKQSTASPAHHHHSSPKTNFSAHFCTQKDQTGQLYCRSRPPCPFHSIYSRDARNAPNAVCWAAGHRELLSSHLRSCCRAMHGQGRQVPGADGLLIGPVPNPCRRTIRMPHTHLAGARTATGHGVKTYTQSC